MNSKTYKPHKNAFGKFDFADIVFAAPDMDAEDKIEWLYQCGGDQTAKIKALLDEIERREAYEEFGEETGAEAYHSG